MQTSDQPLPFLDFYQQRGIIPVRQDTGDLSAHFLRRKALYWQIGCTPGNIRGRRIIEFGPGTGDNAIYLASLMPSKIVLVDGNPSSIDAINERMRAGLLGPNCEVHCSDIPSYQSSEKFDLVICEGTIPGQADPAAFLRHVAGFADDNGIVVITTISAESYLSEICRRILKSLLIQDCHDDEAVLKRLVSYFSVDLQSLPGVSRRHDDWVLDNIIHPWTKRGELLPVDMAIKTLADQFSVLSSSPRMLQDWRWFKVISNDPLENAELAVAEYLRWSLYLLDYRFLPTTADSEKGKIVADISRTVFEIERTFPENPTENDYSTFQNALRALDGAISGSMPMTLISLRSFISGLSMLIDAGQTSSATDQVFSDFRSWFGRGQQYLSFVKTTK